MVRHLAFLVFCITAHLTASYSWLVEEMTFPDDIYDPIRAPRFSLLSTLGRIFSCFSAKKELPQEKEA